MSGSVVGVYEPPWVDADGRRIRGVDEDVLTMAVAAGVAALDEGERTEVTRVSLVTQKPDVLAGFATEILARGLGVAADTAVDIRIGGAAAALDELAGAGAGTLVLAVDPDQPAVSAAVLVGAGGLGVEILGRSNHSLPMRVDRVAEVLPHVYGDARLQRERVWRVATDAFLSLEGFAGENVVAVGIPGSEAARLGLAGVADVRTLGAAAPLIALAGLGGKADPARVIAFDDGGALGCVISAASALSVKREAMDPAPSELMPRMRAQTDIPFSMPAYDRALAGKVGMVASRCSCGQTSFPPRRFCLECGAEDETTDEPLPRHGEVYTHVTVHVPIPGVPGPYGLVIAGLDGLDLRVLAHVTDGPSADVSIGDHGDFVLRRVATRMGVDDYGYGWRSTSRKGGGS